MDTTKQREAARRKRQKAAALKAGYPTIDKLAQAILSGQAVVIREPMINNLTVAEVLQKLNLSPES